MEHDFLSTFPARTAEYLTALTYLVSFVFFWRYLAEAKPKEAPAHLAPTEDTEFQIPDGIFVHPGHTWVRIEGKVATVGLDDFGLKLLGRIHRIDLPKPGDELNQGETAWTLEVDGKAIEMIAPVSGRVVEVNDQVRADPTLLHDPYGDGWIVRVVPTQPEVDTRQLLKGNTARHFVHDAWAALLSNAKPVTDAPPRSRRLAVHGLAETVDPEHWDAVAREQFLTGGGRS